VTDHLAPRLRAAQVQVSLHLTNLPGRMLSFGNALPLRLSANFGVDERVQKDGGSSPSSCTETSPFASSACLLFPVDINQQDRLYKFSVGVQPQNFSGYPQKTGQFVREGTAG
jgi:hypothetical protein